MCTRVLWNDNGQAVVVGRNMDWMEDMGTNLWALPAGGERRGLAVGETLSWPVKYGSVVATGHDLATTDGINDAGFAAHLLWLAESDYGSPDPTVPGVSVALWAQMFLDRFATVAEAVEFMAATPFQVRELVEPFSGERATVHLALDDAAGDSAVIEYLDGQPHVHHGRDLTVMTNSPPYDEQLALLGRYDGLGGDQPLPGTHDPADRFVRASYYLARLPEPSDPRQAFAELLSVMRNAAQPFGVADPERPNVAATLWRTMADLSDKVYLFESSYSPDIVHVRLDGLDLADGAPVRKLDLAADRELVGDVTHSFARAEPFAFAMP